MANFNLLTLYSRTRDERYAPQKDRFDAIKEDRWQRLSEALRTIEVVPSGVFQGSESGQRSAEAREK
jgi:hypothetical protein